MSNTKISKPKAEIRTTPTTVKSTKQEPPAPVRRQDGTRETIESVVFAFILAFLFRTFEAEAFVIPTGSMAPTLMGRHKDLDCQQCGYHFTVGASEELREPFDRYDPDRRIRTVYCPNCRFENQITDAPVFKGDRILVNKFPYEFGSPTRFDVGVFKYPEDPKTNYIKRIVGLPGEYIRVARGDVYRRTDDTGPWQILRKDNPDKQKVLQLVVYDNDHPEAALLRQGWPERWAPLVASTAQGGSPAWDDDAAGWQAVQGERAFELKPAKGAELHWLRYRNFVPTKEDWSAAVAGLPPNAKPRPQMITDFCGYNAYTYGLRREGHFDDDAVYWVGDLTLSCSVDIRIAGDSGQLLLDLNEGERSYRCRIDVKSGKATLYFVDARLDPAEERPVAEAETNLQGAGKHDVRFANVDDRLCLWIDDSLVKFSKGTDYEPPAHAGPQTADLIPAGIAASNLDVKVSRILIERDIYYRSDHVTDPEDFNPNPTDRKEYQGQYAIDNLGRYLDDPEKWDSEYSKYSKPAEFGKLGPDEFFMLGDNSPRSKDSRLWSNMRGAANRHAVPRSALVGKAFFIYWPHGIPFLNGGEGYPVAYHRAPNGLDPEHYSYAWLRIPFYPNIWRMERIR